MIKQLWSHSRNINVTVFQHKVVYNIPLYGDLIFKNLKAEYKNCDIILTTSQEPIQHHLVEPLCDNPLIESERLGENDKYLSSHQLAFREMK